MSNYTNTLDTTTYFWFLIQCWSTVSNTWLLRGREEELTLQHSLICSRRSLKMFVMEFVVMMGIISTLMFKLLNLPMVVTRSKHWMCKWKWRQTIRGRGRPKKTIREVIKKDLEINDLDRSMVLDRTLWRKLIHVADPT